MLNFLAGDVLLEVVGWLSLSDQKSLILCGKFARIVLKEILKSKYMMYEKIRLSPGCKKDLFFSRNHKYWFSMMISKILDQAKNKSWDRFILEKDWIRKMSFKKHNKNIDLSGFLYLEQVKVDSFDLRIWPDSVKKIVFKLDQKYKEIQNINILDRNLAYNLLK